MRCRRSLFLLVFTLFLTPAARAQVPPEKALSTFKVSPGLEMSLWASEPLFVNPTCIDVDHKGRVWVCESVNYRHTLHRRPPRRPEGDRILILEDSSGNGVADKVTVFYQSKEILAPMGIAVAQDPSGPGCKVYVCQSPDILLFEDKDGAGKADGPPRKLLSGFRGIDHDHGVHGIYIGPDSKLYFSIGDQGVGGLVDKKGRKLTSNNTDVRAGTIWRCDLDGKNLELIAHNFRNEYEPCTDSFGTVFVSDNDDDGNQQTRICYVMPGGNYGYHPRGAGQTHWHEEQPGVVPKILRTYFGSPTGMCVYEGTLLPEKYRGQLLHTDAGPRQVRCYHLTAEGAGYAVEREDMVESTDNWFRPSDVCVAPDGSLLVADWYDPGVGGHGMGDVTRGRIYRIAPKGWQARVPKVDLESKEGLTAALASPALSVRYMAMAKLWEMGSPKALEVLESAAAQKENVWLRARALWQLGRLGRLRQVTAAFHDPDPRFRILAMRILHDFHGQTPVDYVTDWKQRLVDDPSAAVRREGLLLLRDADPAKAASLILSLAQRYDGKDRFYLAAVGIAVGQDPAAKRTILADFDKVFPEWNEKVANLIWELRPPEVLPLLSKRLTDPKVSAAQRVQIVDILAGRAEPAAANVLLAALVSDPSREVRERVVEHFKQHLAGPWRTLRQSKDLHGAIGRMLDQPDTRLSGLALVAAAADEAFLTPVMVIAFDRKESLPVRRAAVQALGQLKAKEATESLLHLVTDAKVPSDLAVEAVLALGRKETLQARQGLEDMAGDAAKYKLPQRQAAVAGLASTRPGTTWLLTAHAKGQLAKDLIPDLARLLRNSPYPDLRNQALIAFPPPGKLDPKNLPSIPALLARKGNAARGRQLIVASLKNDVQCLKCHTIRGQGGNVGPDLSVIGKKASRENLLESILYPSRAIADQYITWTVETKAGGLISGLLIEDAPGYVLLRDANAKDHKIARKEIESKVKSPLSIMPADLLVYMSEDNLLDIVEYLGSLKTPALTPASWHIIGPFDNTSDIGMKKVYPPEKAIDLKATYAGKSGKVSWKTVQPDAQGYVDLQAFYSGDSSDVIAYMYCEVESPAAQDVRFLLGTDDVAQLWVNGKSVYTNLTHRAALPEQDEVRVRLEPGLNRLLLKVGNGDGPYGFYLTIMAEQELKLVRK